MKQIEFELQPTIIREFSNKSVKRQEVTVATVAVQIEKMGILNTTLVSIETTKTVDHFLRIYSADLAAPILGDHLFGYRVVSVKGTPVKTSPTRLSPGSIMQVSKSVVSMIAYEIGNRCCKVNFLQNSILMTEFE